MSCMQPSKGLSRFVQDHEVQEEGRNVTAFLRSHRRRAGLTLDALASSTGLTKSYLSKVERGLSTPSIAVALKIARALDTDVGQLFSENPDETVMTVERHDERVQIPEDASTSAAVYDAMATRMVRKSMQPFIVHPTTEAGSEYMEHAGEEFIFVQSGVVEVTIPNRVIVLEQGDSMYFDSNTPHRIRSVSDDRAVLLVVVHDHGGDRSPDTTSSPSRRRCGPAQGA